MNEVRIVVEKMLKSGGKRAKLGENPRNPLGKVNKVDRGRK